MPDHPGWSGAAHPKFGRGIMTAAMGTGEERTVGDEPQGSRPFMPGYGILGPTEGTGLLPWSWATERLAVSHDYWLATVWPDGRPHVMPVWGVWHGEALWFSSGGRSRKARNVDAEPRASVTTDNPLEPVVLDGRVERVKEMDAIAGFAEAVNRKYSVDYPVDFYDPEVNGTFRLRPHSVFGLDSKDFSGSPTRWVLGTD
jgi:PPOX class probable F420-dependent enzyme